ncbi:MAG: riboflavin synthase [Bdellovibrionales bacterium]|nr:riboflavin synthase [Bdellovibrionales bacterium]
MFSGIVEALSPVIQVVDQGSNLRLTVERPSDFSDIKPGDSICCNGVCLTVENFDQNSMQFTLGLETLQVTGWTAETFRDRSINLERSLRMGDRIHGHMVTGHVETMAQVSAVDEGQSWVIDFKVENLNRKLIWHKGSVTLNGVSLTVNKLFQNDLQVCLIPETIERTNLGRLRAGDRVTVEYDVFAKAVVNYQEQKLAEVNV